MPPCHVRGPNLGETRVNMKAGYGMTKVIITESVIKISRDLFILTYAMQDKKKIHIGRRTTTLTRRDGDKYSDWDGMGGLSQKK